MESQRDIYRNAHSNPHPNACHTNTHSLSNACHTHANLYSYRDNHPNTCYPNSFSHVLAHRYPDTYSWRDAHTYSRRYTHAGCNSDPNAKHNAHTRGAGPQPLDPDAGSDR